MNITSNEANVRNNGDLKIAVSDKSKNETCSVKNRTKADINLDHKVLYKQCFSGNDFQSQYEEECPVNYSLKYSETESCKINKIDSNEKFKFAEYAETDLDQPTDFSLKYGESSGEETKPTDFNFYERTEQKATEIFTVEEGPEIIISREQNREPFSCENETPLMFSRCSSLNSLSSLEHIIQSTPDDRSSIVSEFSRATSGIISPSELPDSPAQTAPSSPKRNKSVGFPFNSFLREKKSVFEDDVATYKQEDTPIEFSCATSLSSLNIENSVKVEFNLKTNSKASSLTGGDDPKAKDESHIGDIANKFDAKEAEFTNSNKQNSNSNSSLDKVEDILLEKMSGIRLNDQRKDPQADKIKNSNKKDNNQDYQIDENEGIINDSKFKVTTGISPVFSDPTYEASDDDVHTYHTEGTPANISQAGSSLDLSTLSMIAKISPSGTENNSDNDSSNEKHLLSECDQIEILEMNKGNTFKSFDEETSGSQTNFGKSCTPFEEALVEQCIRLGMPQKTNLKKLNTKNRKPIENRGIDNWPSKFCTPLEEALVEQCIRLGMPRKNKKLETTSTLNLIGRPLMKGSEQRYFINQKNTHQRSQYYDVRLPQAEMRNISCETLPVTFLPSAYSLYSPDIDARMQSVGTLPTDIWYNESCTSLEDALVEQCIRLGMPHKGDSKVIEGNASKWSSIQEEPQSKVTNLKSLTNKSKINQSSLNFNFNNQEKETSKKIDRFICNPARRLITRRKRSKETCRKCKKCKEKSKGGT